MSDYYPKTVTVHGSGGEAQYCAVTGGASSFTVKV